MCAPPNTRLVTPPHPFFAKTPLPSSSLSFLELQNTGLKTGEVEVGIGVTRVVGMSAMGTEMFTIAGFQYDVDGERALGGSWEGRYQFCFDTIET
ncbi:hypothetical protein VKT23_011137 [Stygiomarasmius scandens]|uniref:Dirigent protein n=1 Tax=Marasmiellus scandens TaxID=2682957 RepID=A0ABR1JA11_9AGAR